MKTLWQCLNYGIVTTVTKGESWLITEEDKIRTVTKNVLKYV